MSLELSIPSKTTRQRKLFGLVAVLVWLLLIGFSSTSLAGHSADSFFERLTNNSWLHLRRVDPYPRYLVHFVAEKNVHLLLFTIFAILLYQLVGTRKGKAVLVLTIGGGVGIASEIIQGFFPGRDPTLRDALINLSGTCLGVGICWLLERAKRQRPASVAEPG